ncbi:MULTISPECIES: TM2 domain-containing protein [Psychrilyobacter]|uniref:TM2 domain-containing protein n=1 Tax=Psychrilyobacter piezotolerans TaxID=2293438 RepID=A0ABX9KKA6_9FUSO|nr:MULTISPECIES: TM2 domain-containing protein [Psychrilyobacter]MCS5421621.1 TM2 domain-containing protein [Psychrilyobacter sp. S5]NDI76684.1 TM2 domain-containing protein [Psychrilyobacter piezotolerans]RDE65308.1 TM2 domain-containing protein [Psychrilyobacter sp. S5]REI42926.1 TM2 domain-containing protein [Psychrilyobacter piezotolerans]
MKKITFILTLLSALLLTSCSSLNPAEKQQVLKLKSLGIQEDSLGTKSPAAAGALNLLPGGGNFYLGQTGPAIGNLLFWPVSAVWGVPQAIMDAKTINTKETVAYYNYNPEGKKEIARREGMTETNSPANSDSELEKLKKDLELMKLKNEIRDEIKNEVRYETMKNR